MEAGFRYNLLHVTLSYRTTRYGTQAVLTAPLGPVLVLCLYSYHQKE